MLVTVFLGVLVATSQAAEFKLPPYVKKLCNKNDPELNKCALQSAKEIFPNLIKGDPKLKLLPLDPLQVELIELKPMGNSKSMGLVIKCVKCNITGVANTNIEDVTLDFDRMELNISTVFPELVISGDYDASGNILLLPITGHGLGTVKTDGVKGLINLKLERVKKNGEEVIQIKDYIVNFDMKHFYIKLENLFNGDKNLGDNMNKFMNENWKDLLRDLKPAISETIGEIVKGITNQVLSYLPYNKIFTE